MIDPCQVQPFDVPRSAPPGVAAVARREFADALRAKVRERLEANQNIRSRHTDDSRPAHRLDGRISECEFLLSLLEPTEPTPCRDKARPTLPNAS